MMSRPGSPGEAELKTRLAAVGHPGLLDDAIALDLQLGRREAADTFVYWTVDTVVLSTAANRLSDFDREARRAVVLTDSGTDFPRPAAIGSAGFQVSAAGIGSVDLILDAIGLSVAILMSTPVQYILTVQALLGNVRSLSAWIGRHAHTTGRSTLAELESQLAELRSEQGSQAQLTWTPSGPQVRGATRVTVIRRYPDGTVDYIDFEG